jgi:tetratricopeptide (TPR) repeat protein
LITERGYVLQQLGDKALRGGITMLKNVAVILSMSLVLLTLGISGLYDRCEAEEIKKDREEVSYNKKGLDYFKKGFYELAPKSRSQEAAQYYELAILEFKKAIATNDRYVEAHRNLARVYYVQKKFGKSIEKYKNVTLLDPYDIDTYVNLALAYVQRENYDQVIEQLETAKNWTENEAIIDKLNGYIKKLEQER